MIFDKAPPKPTAVQTALLGNETGKARIRLSLFIVSEGCLAPLYMLSSCSLRLWKHDQRQHRLWL